MKGNTANPQCETAEAVNACRLVARYCVSSWSIVRSEFPAETPRAVHMVWSGDTGQAPARAYSSRSRGFFQEQ